jgi:DNA-binding XRE family transcriptional regulator
MKMLRELMTTNSPPKTAINELKRLRTIMGWTQCQAATFLGLSKKAIESYEQGWRRIPERVLQDLLTLVAAKRRYPGSFRPCFKVLNCPDTFRDVCFCRSKMAGRFCWLTASACCHQNHPEFGKGMTVCLRCPVVQQFL